MRTGIKDTSYQARSSIHKPFPAKNKYLLFDFTGYRPIEKGTLREAINETCDMMLNPPAKLLGINGILKFSNEILKWKKFSIGKLKLSGITNYFQISKDGGTGGGIFRKLYGNFLIEASSIMKNDSVNHIGNDFIEIAEQWDRIGEYLWQLGLNGDISLLRTMSDLIVSIYYQEKALYQSLQNSICVD